MSRLKYAMPPRPLVIRHMRGEKPFISRFQWDGGGDKSVGPISEASPYTAGHPARTYRFPDRMSGNCPFKRARLTPAKLHHTGQILFINAPPLLLLYVDVAALTYIASDSSGSRIRARDPGSASFCAYVNTISYFRTPANFSVGVTSGVVRLWGRG